MSKVKKWMIRHRIADWEKAPPGQTGIEVRGMEAVMLHIYSAHAKRQADDQLAAQRMPVRLERL
ncbi:hypothetical protein IVB14_16550 [Bradyrhizobium sp. 180]|uniref:hypothetical protein n=1 Tax=Bradyrhizobium sp. 180 TaxID=2782650 RepID=UPI001FFAD529|nr:hypothetical protein [Bradyrhizobium sp. 180]MCK1491988.1 hypothetical protein [Bradyrhizobium sp. 180]